MVSQTKVVCSDWIWEMFRMVSNTKPFRFQCGQGLTLERLHWTTWTLKYWFPYKITTLSFQWISMGNELESLRFGLVNHTSYALLTNPSDIWELIIFSFNRKKKEDIRKNTQTPKFKLVKSLGMANQIFYWTNGYEVSFSPSSVFVFNHNFHYYRNRS